MSPLERLAMPRAITWAIVAFAFAFSFLVFAHSALYGQFRSAVAALAAASGLSLSTDFLLLLLCAILLAVGLFYERSLRLSIAVSWLMLFPSLLYFSRIDWAYIFGLPFDNRAFSNDLDPAFVFLCGVVLLAAGLVLRSRLHMLDLQANLRRRLAPEEEIEAATESNFSFLLLLTAGAAAASIALFIGASLLWPWISGAASGMEYAYLVIGMMGLGGLVVAFGLFVWWRGWKEERSRAPPAEKDQSEVLDFDAD
jgi:hypothetical protein